MTLQVRLPQKYDAMEASDLLILADRYVKRWRRTRLNERQRWDAFEEVEMAHLHNQRGRPDDKTALWADVLVLTMLAYLMDNGSLRRDDFDTARRMLTKESEE